MSEMRAKLFVNGRSQAVRLPRDFRFEGTEVRIWRVGETVVLAPVGPDRGDLLGDLRREMRREGPMKPEVEAMLEEAIRKMGMGDEQLDAIDAGRWGA